MAATDSQYRPFSISEDAALAELKLIVGESPDMAEKLLAELDMDIDGLRTVAQDIRQLRTFGAALQDRRQADHIRGILEPMAARFAAYIQAVRLLDEGIR